MFVEITRKKLTAGDSRLAQTHWAARGLEKAGRRRFTLARKLNDRNVGRATSKRNR